MRTEKPAEKAKTRQFGAKRGTKSTDTGKRTTRTSRPSRRSSDTSDEETKPKRSFRKKNEDFHTEDKPRRTYKKKTDDHFEDEKPRRSFKKRENDGERTTGGRKFGAKRPFNKPQAETEEAPKRKRRNVTAESPILSEIVARRQKEGRFAPQKQKVLSLTDNEKQGLVRLNKYIANAGICSRREADVLISTGAVTVNGEIITELGYKVKPTDEVRYGDKVLQNEKPVYILLNKPKDYITTTSDERGRKDVMELVRGACKERIYPVGRLDKNTTGLLLFTNDGDLTKKLTHPKHGIEKTYAVELNKNFANIDLCALRQGIELEDGVITPDEVAFYGESKRDVGITIHSGKNRIVRRIFEFLGYEVVKLDRVVFAGLTKKDLPRGKWRFLTQAEINILKMTIK